LVKGPNFGQGEFFKLELLGIGLGKEFSGINWLELLKKEGLNSPNLGKPPEFGHLVVEKKGPLNFSFKFRGFPVQI